MNLLKVLGTVSGLTMLSRVLAFGRDVLIARMFGAGMMTDAFFVAFKLPNLLRRMFAEGAFSQAFVPIFAEYKNRKGHDETKDLVDHVVAMLSLVLFVVTLIGVLGAPLWVYLSAPGFADKPEQFNLTVDMLRITFPYIFFISLVAVAAALLNSYNKFWVPAFAPVLLNICFIGGALWFAPYFDPPIMVLAWAVFVAGIVQLLFQLPFLKQIGLIPRLRFNWRHEGMRRVIKQMAPAMFGVSIAQINLIINTVFASLLAAGSVSWLYYADRLMEFPSGVLGAALGTILLPSLSKCFADDNMAEYSRLLDWGLRLTIVLALPCAVALGIVAVPMLSTFFQYGAFDAHDVLMSSDALVGYSVGLMGLILIKILAPGFYAKQDIKTPVKIGVFTLIATQLMNVVFIYGFGWKHEALAWSIGLGACLNSAVLFYFLRKKQIYQPEPGWSSFLFKVVFAVTVFGIAEWYAVGDVNWWLTNSGWERVWYLIALVVGGIVLYFTLLWSCGFRLRDFSRRAID